MKHYSKQLTTLLTASMLAAWPASAQARPTPPEGPPSGDIHSATPTIGKTAVLGVVAERIDDELRYQLPVIQAGAGLIIRQLMQDGPAAQANMAVMDILLKWNDQLLVHPAQLQVLVESSKPGDAVNLEYLHMGTLTKARITLAEKTAPDAGLGALLGRDVLKEAARAAAKSGINPNTVADILKALDFGKSDPMTWLDSKILLIRPDGTRQEIQPGDLLKKCDPLNELLKSLAAPRHPCPE